MLLRDKKCGNCVADVAYTSGHHTMEHSESGGFYGPRWRNWYTRRFQVPVSATRHTFFSQLHQTLNPQPLPFCGKCGHFCGRVCG